MFGGLAKPGGGGRATGGGGRATGGGGRGGGKRASLPLSHPPLHNPRAVPPAASRLGIGGRDRHGSGPGLPAPSATLAQEESFSMVSRDPLNFAAIIRLTPDLVDEIRRLEAQGGAARIKFDSNLNNPVGNVIDVGGKEFRFTSSQEVGDLCDIYEERKNGEDGQGLLAERGSAWRKLNVHRILDESAKNHVKMLSEEAERKSKSRKSIVLDPTNPSVKNQAKTMAAAAVEGNMRRMNWKQKEPAFKKKKVESSQGLPSKSFSKSGTSFNNAPKGRHSASPLPSPPEQAGPGASASPFGTGKSSRGYANADEVVGTLASNKEDAATSEKEIANKISRGPTSKLGGHKGTMSSQKTDLRSLLIRLLSEKPKGMSLKALEKAVGETNPNLVKKIKSVIKNIATFHDPGRYLLKPGVDMENFKKPLTERGSSPESAPEQSPNAGFVEKGTIAESEQLAKINLRTEESDIFEKIEIEQNSPDPFTDMRKGINESDVKACSSSENGSASESGSDSSDSGSDSESQSRSRSKSKSPLESGSASSSDSESGGSSSSSQESDEDVDILKMDDDKDETNHMLQATESRLCLTDTDGSKQEARASASSLKLNDFERDFDMAHAVEITEDTPIVSSIKTSESLETAIIESTQLDPYQKHSRSSQGRAQFSPDLPKKSESQQVPCVGSLVNNTGEHAMRRIYSEEKLMAMNGSCEKSVFPEEKSRAKFQRASDSKQTLEKPESSKRFKATSSAQPMASGNIKDTYYTGNSRLASPDKPEQEQYKERTTAMSSIVNRDENTVTDLRKGHGLAVPGKSMKYGNLQRMHPSPDFKNASDVDAQQSGQRAGDPNARARASDGMERYVENFDRGPKHAERISIRPDESDTFAMRNMPLEDKSTMSKDKLYKVKRDENGDTGEKHLTKNYKERFVADKLSSLPDSHSRRSSEQSVTPRDTRKMSQVRNGDIDESPVTNGKGNILTRELSDLELGEFREPVSAEDTQGGPKQFGKKNSFKTSENKLNAIGNLSSDWGKGRTSAKTTQESKIQSPPILKGGLHGNQDGFYKKMSDDDIMDSTRPQQRTILLPAQQPRADHTDSEAVSHMERSADTIGRNETTCQGIGPGNHAAGHKKTPAGMLQQQDARDDSQMGMRDFYLEEDDSYYAKYGKDEPVLKGPIKDFLQYKEYVQEYQEKYECYLSLNKNLESYRNDFLKYGRDLELAKGRDMEAYYNISDQMKKIYRQIKTRHTRMKNTFIVLHEELKALKQRMKDFAAAHARD